MGEWERGGIKGTVYFNLCAPSTLRRKGHTISECIGRGRDGRQESPMGPHNLRAPPFNKAKTASALACNAYTPQRNSVLLVWGETLSFSDVCTYESRLGTRTPPSFCQEMQEAATRSSVCVSSFSSKDALARVRQSIIVPLLGT